jgi:hypothetical protein
MCGNQQQRVTFNRAKLFSFYLRCSMPFLMFPHIVEKPQFSSWFGTNYEFCRKEAWIARGYALQDYTILKRNMI